MKLEICSAQGTQRRVRTSSSPFGKGFDSPSRVAEPKMAMSQFSKDFTQIVASRQQLETSKTGYKVVCF